MKGCLYFGTDGIRGNASEFPFTDDALKQIAYALGLWLVNNNHLAAGPLIIGQDTRISCQRINNILIQELALTTPVVDAGIIPTPALSRIIAEGNYCAGVMISASHNPFYDNGIKIFTHQGYKINKLDEEQIVSYFHHEQHNQTHQSIYHPVISLEHAQDLYIASIIKNYPAQFLQGITIVLDAAHGAAYRYAPALFSSCGARVIALNTSPNGTNINEECGATSPEYLQQAVVKHKAHAGFAFDGDGDRVIAVNASGTIYDGDDILFLLAQKYHYPTIVGTIMANQGFEEALAQQGISLDRVNVGDKNIMQKMLVENILLGGENSGHIILHPYTPTGDGLAIALECAFIMHQLNNWSPATFFKYPRTMVNSVVQTRCNLHDEPYARIIQKYMNKIMKGRIVARFSGTENLLRIMVEDTSEIQAATIAHALSNELTTMLERSII